MNRLLKSTTCLMLGLSLGLPPAPVRAADPVAGCKTTKNIRVYPCLAPDGSRIRDVEEYRAYRQAAKAEAGGRSDGEDDAVETGEDAETNSGASTAGASETGAAGTRKKSPTKEVGTPAANSAKAGEAGGTAAKAKEAGAATAKPGKPVLTDAEKAKLKKERRDARKKAKAAAGGAGGAAAKGVKVTTDKVTRENTRSSSEEFAQTAAGKPTAQAESSDDDGLSAFEKALLLGLGAVVVGTILNNGDEVVSSSDDRVVVERDGELRVLKNDDALLRQPGSDVRTETFYDGSTRNTVTRDDGSQIVTIRDVDGTVLSRTRITPEGEAITFFDDTVEENEVVVSALPAARSFIETSSLEDQDALRRALAREQGYAGSQRFSLRQVREIPQVRALAPEIELNAIEFPSGSAAIRPIEARSLSRIGEAIVALIDADPRTVLLIEGHTDAVGSDFYNLALSDRRAETVALALTEYFDVPPENMIVQGYGESALKVKTLEDEPANRRVVVRNITGLMR